MYPIHGSAAYPDGDPPGFLNPDDALDTHRRRLPHWQQEEVWCFVTWRLADSVPQQKLKEWSEEKGVWLRTHPKPWNEATEHAYHERFTTRMEDWLDQGTGSCLLKHPDNSKIVAGALAHFDGHRYVVSSYVVMPNHVHVLFRPNQGERIGGILQSWKGYTAREINRSMNLHGALWQDEYWDRLVRSEQHFVRCLDYIKGNPARARLGQSEYRFYSREGSRQ